MALNFAGAIHLLGCDNSKLAWLNTLLNELSSCVSCALTPSEVYVLEVSHLGGFRCYNSA